MIELEARPARTFFSGPEKELHKMFRCLRVKMPGGSSFWKAKAALRRSAYIWQMSEEDREAEKERIIAAAEYTKFYNRRNDSFLSGLLPRVKKYLKRKHITYKVTDLRKPIPTSGDNFKKIKFQDKIEQREEQILAVKQSLDIGRGILACATNAGKTDVAASIIYEFWAQTKRVPQVLFIVHRTGVAKQSMERFQRHLDSKVFPIAMLGGGNKKIPKRSILASTTQTAALLTEDKNQDFLKFLQGCDILIFDEFHVNRAYQASKVADNCAATMRFGLSGTIDEDSKVKMLHYTGLCGPIIARISNKELVEKGRSARPHIRFIETSAPKLTNVKYAQAYRDGIVYCRERNRSIVKEALCYANKNLPTLVMVGRLKHGYKLRDKLRQKTDVPIEFIQGSTPLPVRQKMIQKFEQGKIAILIASPIFDVGVDIPEIGACVFAGGGLGWELILQRLGRILRRKKGKNRVLVTDFIDRHNKHLMKHSVARLRHFAKEEIATFEFLEAK